MGDKNVVLLLLAFFCGVAVTSGYVYLTAQLAESALTAVKNAPLTSGSLLNNIEPRNQSPAFEVVNTASLTAKGRQLPIAIDKIQTLETQLSVLKSELAVQRQLAHNYQLQLQTSSDFQQTLLTQFDQQRRDHEWAFQVETALNDFILTADLSIKPDVVNAECKSTVCKFQLTAPQGNDNFNHHHWREFNDKLIQQTFWQQFKSTTSNSTDTALSILVSKDL
ncbi:hypothetical protein [Pseudoalteromonas mariniglutinosa]|uniref:hypothetical protein n=1 Tax=Pseudoalteromonas mariniglutinosa TaxID=206042 RepID=UPI00384ED299